MAVRVFRTSEPTKFSDYGNEMTADADVTLAFEDEVKISFSTKKSRFAIQIEPGSFKKLAEYMMLADENEAIKAFGAAMINGIEQPKNSN
jgi:hypothetical protein